MYFYSSEAILTSLKFFMSICLYPSLIDTAGFLITTTCLSDIELLLSHVPIQLSFPLANTQHHSFQMGACSLKEGSNGSIGSRTLLSLKVNRAKKEVTHSSSPIRQYNSVGAFGYGIVLANPCIPENDFFKPDLRFRIRLRFVGGLTTNQECDVF